MVFQKLNAVLYGKKIDAIAIFSQSPTFRYLLGQKLESGIILITKKENILYVNELSNPKIKGFKTLQYGKDFEKQWKNLLNKNRIKKIGIDEFNILSRQKSFLSKYVKLLDVHNLLEELRICKTHEEIKKIKKACEITDEVFSLLIKNFKNFKSEKEAELFVRMEFLRRGAECAYDPIIASGKNAAIPHHVPGNQINKGFVVIDIGAKYEGYCSDMTRTIYNGTPSRQDIEIYEKVLWIENECISKARMGLKCSELHDLAVELFGNDARYFTHTIGHGFGVEIHELPRLYTSSKEILQKGSVFTIEPGYYNQKRGIGIRIEDNIYLGKKKQILNKTTKELIVIKH